VIIASTVDKGNIMGSILPFGLFAALAAAMLAIGSLAVAHAESPAPGGFLESATSMGVRPKGAATLPDRGRFAFPAPYNSTGVRLTNAADCGGGRDCVNDVGYAYWRNSNNHVGADTMLIVVTLDRARGGNGPTLFGYDKMTDAVTVLGPLFDAGSPLSWATGEGWYFSATKPNALYVNDGRKLYRYDVLGRTLETVFDVRTRFGPNRYLWQTHSSNDDRVHSATLRASDTYAMLGCMIYRESTRQFSYFPASGDFDECQVDKSGRWLLIKENVDGASGEDNRVIDLEAGAATVLLDQQGAGGHSDNGYGYMVAEDNWSPVPGAVRVWTFGTPMPGPAPQGRLVYRTTDWSLDIGHLSHANARPDVPVKKQYACGAQGTRLVGPRANEIVCFRLDASQQVLVVAPTMTDLDAAGGGTSDYTKLPKGNLDITGRYFIWSSNAGRKRLDVFVVKVPSELLVAAGGPVPPDEEAPTVTVTAPAAGAVVFGTIALTVSASDNVGVAGVQYKLSGTKLGAEVTTAPFSLAWNTAAVADGAYKVKAVARDAAGNIRTSPGTVVTVSNNRANVLWSQVVNATATGASLAKTGGCDGCADAGAISAQTIAAAGYVEFRATETSSLRIVGLGKSATGTPATPVKFAFTLQPGGIAEVRENGVYRAETPFASGDIFRITVAGLAVIYTKNGALIYERTLAAPQTLRVRATLYSAAATVTGAVVSMPR
jgi:hypothetical protein